MNFDLYMVELKFDLYMIELQAAGAVPSAPGPPATNITEGGDRARAFAFCASGVVCSPTNLKRSNLNLLETL